MTDEKLDGLLGNLLRAGVLLSAAVVLAGGIYLIDQGGKTPAYGTFHGESARLRSVANVLIDACSLDPRGVIELGMLLLIATPIARVAFSTAAYAVERDWIYVAITSIVLAILLYGFIGGAGT